MMRIVLDACVLFPSVLREILIGAAKEGLYHPLWSARILEEWRLAALKKDAPTGATAAIEIALLRADLPAAMVAHGGEREGLYLPDVNDIHVLQTAIEGQAGAILTANSKDFPTRILAQHGLLRLHPDLYLLELAQSHETEIFRVINAVHHKAMEMEGADISKRKLLKSCGLPRLAKLVRSA